MSENTPAQPEKYKWICTECYQLDKPICMEHGNWYTYIPLLIGILALIAIPSILWLVLLTFVCLGNSLAGGFDGMSSMSPFPFAKFIPEAPYTTRTCKNCRTLNQMVDIRSKPGQDAMYWHLKYERGGNITSVDKQSNFHKSK